jgi:nucleoside-triphosphatase THEP1
VNVSAPFAVIVYPDGGSVENLQGAFVARLQGEGVSVGGLLQRTGREDNGRPRMELIDIESGAITLISQNLGANSSACCVDVRGMASAALQLQRAIDRRPECLVINKFSGLEAEGGGFRAEFLDAMASGIPLLSAVAERHRDAFSAMTGGYGEMLPAQIDALLQWWDKIKDGAWPEPDRPVH